MAVLQKIKRAIRGEVKLTAVALEAIRRSRVSLQIRKERANLGKSAGELASTPISRLSDDELSRFVRKDREAKFLPRFLS